MQLDITINDITATTIHIPANPQSTKIWRCLQIFALEECHFLQCPKTLWNSPEGLPNVLNVDNSVQKNHTNFLPSIVQFDWLISNQLSHSLNIYQIDSSALRFPFEFSSNKSTKSTSCFIFLFDLLKIMKLMKKLWKRSRKAFPGRFGALTGRPGDLMKNLETPEKTGRVGRYVSKADSLPHYAIQAH